MSLLCLQAQSPILQLDLITELLGTPALEDMKTACEGAKAHMVRHGHKPPSMAALYTLSSQATHEAVHLLCRMLVFNPVSTVLSRKIAALPPPPHSGADPVGGARPPLIDRIYFYI